MDFQNKLGGSLTVLEGAASAGEGRGLMCVALGIYWCAPHMLAICSTCVAVDVI